MDPDYSLQDVKRCDLCETPVPPLYCYTCHISLCETCTGGHILDESKPHMVHSIKHRSLIPKLRYHKCHFELCKNHGEQCDIPVSVKQLLPVCDDGLEMQAYSTFAYKALQADMEELEKIIYPEYLNIAASFPLQKADLNKNTETLISVIDKRGRKWHREIDNIISKLKSDIKKTESEQLAILKEQEDNINQSISEITQIIDEQKKLLDERHGCLLSRYISRNAEFKSPPKLTISLPTFSSERIDTEQLILQFGSLST